MIAALSVAALFVEPIGAYDRRIEYVGRFDRRDPKGPRGAWPCVEARLEVKGQGVEASVADVGPNWIQVVVDGVPTRAVELKPGVQTLDVRAAHSGTHTFEFIKRTEAEVGTVQFLEFRPQGRLLQAKRSRRMVQVVGDSISCGYGNEAGSQHDSFRPATENAYLTYGSIAARRYDADVEIIAWSGRKMWPDNTMPSVYDLNVPTDQTSSFSFRGEGPEAIVINLATNDFGAENPSEAEWTSAYKEFIGRLRYHYPEAIIYPAVGPMMSDQYPQGHHALTTLRAYLWKVVEQMRREGDRRIRVLDFGTQQAEDGFGADWHPNVKTHEKMAIKLEAVLKRDLRW